MDIDQAWCLDCALESGLTYPAGGVAVTFLGTNVNGQSIEIEAGASLFVVGDVGKIVRISGGKAVVTARNSATKITAQLITPLTRIMQDDPDQGALEVDEGDWSMDATFTELTNLWHLEGKEVWALADGAVQGPFTVTGGEITLTAAASYCIVGLKYSCWARTLPMSVGGAVIEGKRKRVVGLAVRRADSVGLKVGDSLTKLYPMKERTDEPWGTAIRAQSNNKEVLIDANWDQQGQVYFVQDQPLPATITGLVLTTEVGDQDGR